MLITTSRDPSSRLKAFAKELKLVFPNSQRMNRGNQVVPQMVEAARGHDFTDIVIVQEHRGEPDGMIVCHLPFGPTAYFGMYNTVLRHDIQESEEIGKKKKPLVSPVCRHYIAANSILLFPSQAPCPRPTPT